MRICKAIALLGCVLIFGCTSSYEIKNFKDPHDSIPTYSDYIIKRPFGEVKIIGVNAKILEMIKRDFYSAPLMAQFSVSKIRISHDIEDKEFHDKTGAHFHLDSKPIRIKFSNYLPRIILPSGQICINLFYGNGLLRHEMTHAQVFFGKISLTEIGKISNWDYKYLLWNTEDQKTYPKDGFLYRYSTKNVEEETANIVAGISNFFFNLQDPYTGNPHAFFGIDKKDVRYFKKVEAVYKLGLTTKIEHAKILEFFSKK